MCCGGGSLAPAMTWYEDLTPYRYMLIEPGWPVEGPPEGGVEALYFWMSDDYEPAFEHDEVNVGWLERGHAFPVGEPDEEFVTSLRHACSTQRWAVMRGLYPCPLCGGAAGHSEIRIQGDGVVYAAPTLVAHYVEAHRYAPPQAFVDAVIHTKGAMPSPVPGKRRRLPEDLRAPERIDLAALRAGVDERIRGFEVECSIDEVEGGLRVVAHYSLPRRGAEPDRFTREWVVPWRALHRLSQATIGISSLINAANYEWCQRGIAAAARARMSRKGEGEGSG